MKSTRVVEQVALLARPLVEQAGYELVDVEYVKEGQNWIVRFFIDQPSGITLDDCEAVSVKLSAVLDAQDPIPHTYLLEVSSPGLERPLKKLEDYRRFAGSQITISTFAPLDGNKVHTGQLLDVVGDEVVLAKDCGEVRISLKEIAGAHLKVDF